MKELKIGRHLSDWLKILACVAVVVSHYAGYLVKNGCAYTFPVQIMGHGGYWGVTIFFLLSGYGLMESQKRHHDGFIHFMQKRLIKVYVPAVLSAILYILFSFFLPDVFKLPSSVLLIARNVLWGWFDEILWFIKIILYLYVTFYFYLLILKWGALLSFLLLICTCFVFYIFMLVVYESWQARSIPAFFVGIAVSYFPCLAYKIFSKPLIVFILLAPLITCGVLFRTSHLVLPTSFDYAFVICLLCMCTKVNSLKLPKMAKCISDVSFDIYLVHGKIITFLSSCFNVIPFIVLSVMTIVGAFLFNQIRKIVTIVLSR